MMTAETRAPHVVSATAKVFKRVVPIMLVMLVCNQLDRSNIGYAQEHLHADVGISAAAYGFGAGVFFIAYAIFEVPSNILLEKFGAKFWLARIMVTWGIVAGLMAFVQNDTMFYVLRFLLGVAEAGFFPAVIFYFARWVPAGSRGRATAIFIAGSSVAAAISGPVAGLLLTMHNFLGVKGWQWMFGIEGGLSVVVGVIVYFLLDSKIEDATWLTQNERTALSGEIADEDAVKSVGGSSKINRWKLILSPQVLLFIWIYFAIQLSIYANTFWLPTIVRRIPGTTDLTVGLLSAIPWVCAIIAMQFAARLQDKARSRKPMLVISLLVAAAGTYAAALVSPVLAIVFLAIAAMGFKSASPLFWSFPQSALDPRILAPAIALVNSIGNLGGFVAPYGFGLIKAATGGVIGGLFGLAFASLLAAGSVYFIRERDRKDGPRQPKTIHDDVRTEWPAPKGAGDR